VEVEVVDDASHPPPTMLDVLATEPGGWLGRTANGLAVANHERAWFTIEGSPPRIRGVLGNGGDSVRDLLLGALLVALRSLGVFTIHAAAVSSGEQALLLVGESGAGKSTTATAMVNAGCRYLGDDGVLIRQRQDDIELLPFWPSFRLTDQSLASFEALRPHSIKLPGDEKWRLDTLAAFPDRYLSHWLGPKIVLFLGRTAGHCSSLQPITQAEAAGLLIAQSHVLSLECHPDPRRHLDLLAQLVSVAHLARLELGTEWLAEPVAAAQRLLDQTRRFPRMRALHVEAS
jgi:hypothetical protein